NILYVALKDYLKTEEMKQTKRTYGKKLGMEYIKDHAHTGIDSQIFDLSKLNFDMIDPRLKIDEEKIKENGDIILNIDYAFGQQGEEIMEQLTERLSGQIKSISIMGKAGIVVENGRRGDIMLPTYILAAISRDIYGFEVDRGNDLKKEHLENLVDKQIFDNGPILCVPGTYLQSIPVLECYIDDWGIIGDEMESYPYIKIIEQGFKKGHINKKTKLQAGYVASDTPKEEDGSLATSMGLEGVSPTYGILIAMLNNILG
ncbi:DUF6909 family protein, partial [Nanoarchaeota archaeon]